MKKIRIILFITLFLSLYKVASAIVTVTLESDKSFGVIPLQVNYTANVDFPFLVTNYEWDLNGDNIYETGGVFNSTATRIYSTAGVYYPKVRVWESVSSTSDSTLIYALESTNVISGTVSGYVDLLPGTYRISSDIIIDSGAVLTIEPGTILRFDQNRYLRVKGNGTLFAGGDTTNTVVFSSFNQNNWAGIIFDSSSSGYFEYSVIEKANHGIKAESYSTISVFNSEIRNNGLTYENGGGIYLSDKSTVIVSESNIYNNKANFGGAFYNMNGFLFVDSCSVSYNSAFLGSGFYNTGNSDTTLVIRSNLIYDTGIVNNDFFVNKSINDQSAYLNWWSTYDFVLIDKSIYDWNDSTIYGLVDNTMYTGTEYVLKNFSPIVVVNSNVSSGNAPLSVTFTANAFDYDGSVANYEWDLDGDGTFDTSVSYSTSIVYSYASTNTYYPNVRVTDNNGAKATNLKIITVTSSNLNNDTTAPTIDISGFGTLTNGQDSSVGIIAKDDKGLSKGEFWVKKNGESDNSYLLIYSEEGASFINTLIVRNINIPGKHITPRGVSYRIKLTDLAGNTKEVTGYLRVKVTNYAVPFPTWTWKMISFPLKPDNNTIDSIFGPLESRRVYRWDPVNKEYSKTYDAAIDPGDAFWLKIKEDNVPDPISINVNGISVDPENVPVITLPPGWSQIADPYAYKIASSKLRVKQDSVEIYVGDAANSWLENQFLTYDVDNSTGKRSYTDLTNISPDIGFWVKNRSSKEITIIFPKYEANITGAMSVNSPFHKIKNDGWGLKLKAMSKNYIDNDNYIGFLPGAINGYDFNDLSEPPPVDSYVSLYFPHSDWGKDNGRYRTDYRASGNFGILEISNYDFTVETNIKDKTTLSWEVINPPLNYRVMLYDKREDKKIDMAEKGDYAFGWPNGELKRDFSIIVEWDNIYLLNSIEMSDLNLNHIVDGEDLSILGLAFGKKHGENKWNPKTDINKDRVIDGSDLFILGNNFGKNY